MFEDSDPALEEFRSVVSTDDDEIDLVHAALVASKFAYPDLAVIPYLDMIDTMALETVDLAGEQSDMRQRLEALLQVVIRRPGLRGAADNSDESYYDPRNSFISDVLERNVGIPIALAIILISVGERAGIPLAGTAMPMHFLIRVLGVRVPLLIDCYDGGHMLNEASCRKTLDLMSEGRVTFREEMIQVIANTAVITRFLTNLKLIYLDSDQFEFAVAVLDRLMILNPDAFELARERGILLVRLGRLEPARRDLRRFIEETNDSQAAEEVEELLRRIP